jgi:predicted 3-demethylubiquinone-9 3-methyltransferase (glyoxalase superfamily)
MRRTFPLKRITPLLCFDGRAGEAMKFYLEIFRDSKLMEVMRNGNQLEAVIFRLNGQEFIALNGSPESKVTPAVAFHVTCKTQREINTLWERLSEGGSKGQCGWLTDQFGISWLIVPKALGDLMWGAKDAGQKERVWSALMQMSRIDIKALKRAANQK